MASPPHIATALTVALGLFTICSAGPLGPLPNMTSLDMGLKEGACTVGDVVYGAGEEVPGGGPCERCRCAGAAVSCERMRCEPRPGCKALHRPDHCCPTYQCECEQEGRVYGNGEKLVDPQDPCRVCYCQGGEVVCRRIACFVRDDCTPRLVPGRCCPEYDNCPLRGVTTVPGVTPSISTTNETPSNPPSAPKENIKQEITIKEITPVSEIPVITDVKIKEILPSPGIEVPDYSSSKSPLIVREATTERTGEQLNVDKSETPAVVELPSPPATSAEPSTTSIKTSEIHDTKITQDLPPSKISLSTQDSINSDIYPSSFATMGSPSVIPEVVVNTAATKAPLLEEEDPAMFDHNPAFPPIPDDLSVLGNHEDETLPEQTADADHILFNQEHSVAPTSPPAETTREEVFIATSTKPPDTTSADTTPSPTFNIIETSNAQGSSLPDLIATRSSTVGHLNTESDFSTTRMEPTTGTESVELKGSPMLNLRSAIPTEILNVPSFVPEEINGEPDDVAESTTIETDNASPSIKSTTQNLVQIEEQTTEKAKVTDIISEILELPRTTSESQVSSVVIAKSSEKPEDYQTIAATTANEMDSAIKITGNTATTEAKTTVNPETTSVLSESTSVSSEPSKVSPEVKSSIVTEITAQTEFSAIPIETSDQNPQENLELIEKGSDIMSTVDPSPADLSTVRVSTPLESEIITVSRAAPSSVENQSFENIETTEFVLTPLGSSETSTDAVELIKISADPGQSAAIIESTNGKKNNVLNDLINLVGDVASIGDHTDSPAAPRVESATAPAVISDSEELIPVNAGYKSKNNNWNQNSITEIPIKSKVSASANKQKIVEIEDEDSDSITDSPPPNDKVEPTTRRPIIDNVSDDGEPGNSTDKKDIEIITKSYVPAFNRRPTKVVMKKSNERVVTEQSSETAHITKTESTETMEEGTVSEQSSVTELTEQRATTEKKPSAESSTKTGQNASTEESTAKEQSPTTEQHATIEPSAATDDSGSSTSSALPAAPRESADDTAAAPAAAAAAESLSTNPLH